MDELLQNCSLRPEGCFNISCEVKNPGNAACDPFEVLDFYETNFWWNIGMVAALGISFRLIAMFILFLVIMLLDYIGKVLYVILTILHGIKLKNLMIKRLKI